LPRESRAIPSARFGQDKQSAEHLNLLAEEYEAEARRLEPPAEPPMPSAT